MGPFPFEEVCRYQECKGVWVNLEVELLLLLRCDLVLRISLLDILWKNLLVLIYFIQNPSLTASSCLSESPCQSEGSST